MVVREPQRIWRPMARQPWLVGGREAWRRRETAHRRKPSGRSGRDKADVRQRVAVVWRRSVSDSRAIGAASSANSLGGADGEVELRRWLLVVVGVIVVKRRG